MDEDLDLLLVADDPLVRAALAMSLESEPGCRLVAQIDSIALEAEGEIVPSFDTLIWDLGWRTDNLMDFERGQFVRPIVVLVANKDQVQTAWNAGARAVVSRESSAATIVAAARAAFEGLTVFDAMVAPELMPAAGEQGDALDESLTPRELEVIRLLAEGLTNKAIARQLSISDHTVKFHVTALLGKLNAQSRTEAVVRATRLGLIAL